MEQSFIAYIENSIKNNWDLDALTDYKGATLQYKDVARKIEKLHIIFEESGIRKGDKIAVCGRNSSHWGVTFLATLTYGAVIVPILHEFKADNVHNIVNHSEAKLLLVGDMVWENLNESAMPLLEGILMMNDFTLLVSRSERLTYAREGRAGGAGCHQLYFGNNELLKRGYAPLPQFVVKYEVRLRSTRLEGRRQDCVYASDGAYVWSGIRIPL